MSQKVYQSSMNCASPQDRCQNTPLLRFLVPVRTRSPTEGHGRRFYPASKQVSLIGNIDTAPNISVRLNECENRHAVCQQPGKIGISFRV